MDWELKNYQGREIKTIEDIMWVCGILTEKGNSNKLTLEDLMALSFIRELSKQTPEGPSTHIEDRFEILDL